MRVLVLATTYPDPAGGKSLMYVHVRNVTYRDHGIQVTVLNFSAKNEYRIDGIDVIPERNVTSDLIQTFDIVIAHAPNIRKHFRLLRRYIDEISHLVLFGHGHEFLRINDCYPPEFPFARNRLRRITVQDVYDLFKLKCWRRFISDYADKTTCVMVSQWMLNSFCKYVLRGADAKGLDIRVIPNGIGKVFLTYSYDEKCDKEFDFITIRSSFDSPKYCIDVVVEAAVLNQNMKFLLIGKGDYFKYNELPKNMTLIDRTLSHEEMLKYVNRSRFALMPTRQDTQGVMACELATYGIPVITSDIEICREMLSSFSNVLLLDTDSLALNLRKGRALCEAVEMSTDKNLTFSEENTVKVEISLLRELANGKNS
ncbi:glycosyltransferase [Adlercreutzia sp. ZJ305]|nr:glycosyltransferase [Adlercreutzia sp. ZJ305]